MIALRVNNWCVGMSEKFKIFYFAIAIVMFFLIGLWINLKPMYSVRSMKPVVIEGRTDVLREQILKGNEHQDLPSEESYVPVDTKGFTFAESALLTASQPTFRVGDGSIYVVYRGEGVDPTVLYKNGKMVWRDMLVYASYSPIRNQITTGNTFVMSFDKWSDSAGKAKVTKNIIYDSGIDVNKSYGFENSFAPAPFGKDTGKFYFFAQKNGTYYLVEGSQKYTLPYELIIDPPCCSAAVFQIISGTNKAGFYARKDGVWRYVEVDVEKLFR